MRKLVLPAALLWSLAACSESPSATEPATPIAPQRASLTQSVASPIPGRYIVQFRKSSSTSLRDAMTMQQSYGGTVERVYTAALNGAVMQLSASALAALRNDTRVLSIEQDQTMAIATVQANATWGLDRIDQRARPLSTTYTYNVSGNGVTAYIIDTGINFAQADFTGRAVTGFDAITPGGTATDCNGHGTHTAGTVGSATYGVAKSVRLVAVRVLDCAGSGSTSSVIAGVDWVTAHASHPAVANMSLGGGYSAALNTAVENSIASGVSYAISAGNSTADACNVSPASAPDAITVGATMSTDAFASFSNYGSCVRINAPGYNITSLWIGASGTTNTISGTSMAAPHVAGVAALYLETNPGATPAQVRSALTTNATANVITGLPANTPNLLLYSGFIGTPSAAPVASFTPSCTLLACTFDASATTALSTATYGWNFGDATSGSGKTTSKTYATGGTYTVTLTVTDANGSSVKTGTVTVAPAVNQAPTATITAPVANGSFVQGSRVSFAGTGADAEDGTLSGTSLVWTSSRDGQIGTGTSFSTTSLTAGTHTITLTAKDSKGATGSATRSITITVAANQPPVATISSPASATYALGSNIAFAGSATDPEDGTLAGASLVWNSSINGQIGTGTSFTTTSLSVGTHVITLTATDSKGATAMATRTITVSGGSNKAPVANFTWSCSTGYARQCLMTSTSTDDVGIVSYAWNWGNGRGETQTVPSTRNTWRVSGTYSVTLTVTDGGGLTSTIVKAIVVP